jgi:hypothetical protein
MANHTSAIAIATKGYHVIAFGMLLLSAMGCGASQDRDRLPVFPAKGTVKLEGSSPQGALIVLHPKSASSHAHDSTIIRPYGTIRSDGTFELTSYETNDGAPAGEYSVTLELRKAIKYPNGSAGPGPNLVPKKYTKSDTSPLLVQIKPGENQLPPIIVK